MKVVSKRILLIGAGGIGSSILNHFGKRSYCASLWVIDFDIIELDNTRTQLLYSNEDVGRYKVEVSKEKMLNTYGLPIHAILGRVEDQPDEFFKQFDFIIGAVDTIATRRHINAVLCRIYEASVVWIDCGSEGSRGQVRIIKPGFNACFECTLFLYQNDEDTFPVCMLNGKPQNKSQCIIWAGKVWWPKNRDQEFSCRNSLHLDTIQNVANEKLHQLNITNFPVTLEEILTVLNSRVPAMIETNDAVAEECFNLLNSDKIEYDLKTIALSDGYYEFSTFLERDRECIQCSKCWSN